MRRHAAVALGLALGALATGVAAQGPVGGGRDPAFEQEILGRLALIDPEAVPIFTAATEASDAGRLEEARDGFLRVLQLAPDFPDALRRLSYVEGSLGNAPAAVAHAEKALALQPTAWNKGALAMALTVGDDPADHRRALDLARQASQEEPQDPSLSYVLLVAAAKAEDLPTLRTATGQMLVLAPQDPFGHYFAGLLAAIDGRWESADRELRLSQRLGMPPDVVDEVLASGIRTQAAQRRWVRLGAYAVIGWAAGLLALFFVGTTLSRATLAAVARRVRPTDSPISARERSVRTVYRAVILLTSLYFYISMPIIIVLVVAVFGGVIYAFLEIGTMPVQLSLFLLAGGVLTLLAIVRSVLTQVRQGDPGRPLPRSEAPALWRLTEEVARRLGTAPIGALYVSPGPEIAVLERGGSLARMRGKGTRSLVLGLGSMAGMSQGQLKAILAHEYGHFVHGDTAGGDLALRVHSSLQHMALGLAAAGQARWYNPAWVYVYLFHRLFLRLTLGASRLQEILADRMAAAAYGADAFASGLRHIVRQGIAFPTAATEEIRAAASEGRNLRNLYALPAPAAESADLETRFAEAMNRPTSPYDSHPAPVTRLELLTGIRGDPPRPPDDDLAAELIPALDRIQEEMTVLIQKRTGLRRIPVEPPGAGE